MSDNFVIVGGGLAAARAAGTLREEGFDGSVTLFSVEEDLPYERPVLSKGYLLGTEARESAFVHDRAWYADRGVELRLGTWVTRVDPAAREIGLENGEPVPYDRLLLATGSWPRRIDVAGADLDGVLYLRDLPEADAILAAIESKRPLVVLGAGWIGLEIAAAAREHDVPVTVLEAVHLPLHSVLGDEVAKVFADLHREHGVDLRLNTGIASIEGADGRVTGVVTSDGDRLEAGAVVVGIGADPQAGWARAAGLAGSDGLDVDARLRTSDPDIFAAGDIAAVDHPTIGQRVRVEHWAWANDTGPVAARAMLDQDVRFDALPFFYSDQYDLGMEYVGYVSPHAAAEVVLRGDIAAQAFQAFWLSNGRVLAGMHSNMWDDGVDPIKELVASGRTVDRERLADPDVPLSDVHG